MSATGGLDTSTSENHPVSGGGRDWRWLDWK